MTATTKPTFTHVGYVPNTGYVHTSNRLYGHSDITSGKRHALSAEPGSGYVACCGEKVRAVYHDTWTDDEIRDHVEATADAGRVTCARCRKVLKIQVYAVQSLSLAARQMGKTVWYTVKGHGKYATKAEVAVPALQQAYPGCVFRVRQV